MLADVKCFVSSVSCVYVQHIDIVPNGQKRLLCVDDKLLIHHCIGDSDWEAAPPGVYVYTARLLCTRLQHTRCLALYSTWTTALACTHAELKNYRNMGTWISDICSSPTPHLSTLKWQNIFVYEDNVNENNANKDNYDNNGNNYNVRRSGS